MTKFTYNKVLKNRRAKCARFSTALWIQMTIEVRYRLIAILYLIGLPIIGAGLGFLFAWILGLINDGVSALGYEISVFVWCGIGLYAGICGFIPLRKMHLAYKSHVSES